MLKNLSLSIASRLREPPIIDIRQSIQVIFFLALSSS